MSVHSSRGKQWNKTRKSVLKRDGYMCMLCKKNPATEVDHIVPKAHGGGDELTNLVAACKPCNLRKGDKVLTRSTYVDTDWFPNKT